LCVAVCIMQIKREVVQLSMLSRYPQLVGRREVGRKSAGTAAIRLMAPFHTVKAHKSPPRASGSVSALGFI